MTWTVAVLGPADQGVRSICPDQADEILATVRLQLTGHADDYQQDRWPKCPDDYFTYDHIAICGGHWRRLEFIVRDSKAPNLLEVCWVEDHPGSAVG